jgi:hypothetical protein
MVIQPHPGAATIRAFSTPGIGAKHVMVYLLPAALRMNALNVAIPRLTCSVAQRPGWLEVCFGDDGSCLLKQKSTMRNYFRSPSEKRCGAQSLTVVLAQPIWRTIPPTGYGAKWLAPLPYPTDQKSMRPR